MFTDDFFIFAPDHVIDVECALFVADIELAVGTPAIKPSKTIRGHVIDIICIRNDCILHTIGMSLSMYLKVVCAFFVTIPLNVSVNTMIPIKVMQRLSSYAIRCADVIGVMLPYSRGFASCLRGTSSHCDVAKRGRGGSKRKSSSGNRTPSPVMRQSHWICAYPLTHAHLKTYTCGVLFSVCPLMILVG